MNWQIKNIKTDEVHYYEPSEVQLLLKNCILKNQKNTAKKIHEGANKTVCSWVLAEEVKILKPPFQTEIKAEVAYNPKKLPYWASEGKNVDNLEVSNLLTKGKRIFTI